MCDSNVWANSSRRDTRKRPLLDLQNLVGIHAHDEIYELVCDLAPPMRRVRGDNDDVARTDLPALTAYDGTSAGGGADDCDRVRIRWVFGILHRSAGHHRPAARKD